MCSVCGCGEGEAHIEGQGPEGHHHHHHHSETGEGSTRLLEVEQDILAQNDAYAAANRRLFDERGILALNLVSSPGSGKTSLLTRSIDALRGEWTISVIEGDQQTANDAQRIRASGAAAVQINTGKGCHLDAHMVGHALETLQPPPDSLLFIENVGNLVCPAPFDLGEAHKVVILSVTEGDDKPLKYPDMFHASDLLLINKIDLLPYVEFDLQGCIAAARRVNPRIKALQLSASSGEGMPDWYAWLAAAYRFERSGRPAGAQGR